MNDIESRLRRKLVSSSLPGAPESLRVRLENLRDEPLPAVRSRRAGWPLVLAPAAVLLVAGAVFLGASAPSVFPVAPSMPESVDGLPVMTVSAILDARSRGGLKGVSVALRGYWSDRTTGHSCVPPVGNPGALEYGCHDLEYGITERREPIFTGGPAGEAAVAVGPHLNPWISSDLSGAKQLFSLPMINGQRYSPVPIVVTGHFDDARATQCQAASRAQCADRFVLDSIVIFDSSAVPTPEVSPSPTTFPSPAPSGLFDPTAPAVCAGDVPYSFVGWTTTTELKISMRRAGYLWAAITKYPVLLGGPDWNDDPGGSGRTFRWWGRRICIAEERLPDVITYAAVPGSSYQEWSDGTHTQADPP
jgi:hypothetical protein